MRIASHPERIWSDKKKQQDGIRASTVNTKQAEQWDDEIEMDDDIHQFFKLDETEDSQMNDLKNNDTWIQAAKDKNKMVRSGKEHIQNKPERC